MTQLFITMIGVSFVLWGLYTVALGFFGAKGTAVITEIRREGGERNEVKRGRYTYNISYTFALPNGKIVDGFTKHIGNAVFVKAEGKTKVSVRYFSFFPYINAPVQDTKPGLGQLILVAVGVFLIFIINKRKKTGNKKT